MFIKNMLYTTIITYWIHLDLLLHGQRKLWSFPGLWWSPIRLLRHQRDQRSPHFHWCWAHCKLLLVQLFFQTTVELHQPFMNTYIVILLDPEHSRSPQHPQPYQYRPIQRQGLQRAVVRLEGEHECSIRPAQTDRQLPRPHCFSL